MYTSFTSTPIFNQPALCFPVVGTMPSTGNGTCYIPFKITALSTQNEQSTVSEVSFGPIIDQNSNLASGGFSVGYGITMFPQITIQAFVDTPCGLVNGFDVSKIFVDGNRTTFGEILAAYYEGRSSTEANNNTWQRTLPLWFRDPYGRVYASPLIYNLEIQKIPAVPFRETFNMVLVVA